MNQHKVVNVVHSIDTEGPLYESLEAKFDRLKDLYNISHIPTSEENFQKLRNGEINLGGLEERVMTTLNGHLVNYNDTWGKIDEMLERIMSRSFREKIKDSDGEGWVFNWHCLDHVGYDYNPRRRTLGYHGIFDHYVSVLSRLNAGNDGIHWHFHPMSVYKDAHRCATSYVNSPELYQILCRKVIERSWFPRVFRAGFQTERPDSNWFLEQWIPFDISNMAIDDPATLDHQIDFKNGRSGNWRQAPSDWSVYHPNHDNYQLHGNCRRWIGRALNVLNRLASIDQAEMDKAFARANSGLPTLVGLASHDFRNLETEVDFLRNLIRQSASKYPDVKFKFCEALDGFRRTIWPEGLPSEKAVRLSVKYFPATAEDVPSLEIECVEGAVFGPQPFLAIQTRSRRFIHDNLDFDSSGNRWYYAFHGDTLPLEDVEKVGVAANDAFGNLALVNLVCRNGELVVEKTNHLTQGSFRTAVPAV